MLSRVTQFVGARSAPTGTLRRLLYGGAPLSPEEMRRATEALGPVLIQVYGRLEGGWPLSVLSQTDHAAILAGDEAIASSCGRPVGPPVELRLRHVEDQAQGVGELCTRGYLHLIGRLDDMINNGYHVYPGQIEAALRTVPGVRDARVHGEPHPRTGEAIIAYVVLDDAATPDVTMIKDRLRPLLPPYKIPRRVHIVEQLPAGRR